MPSFSIRVNPELAKQIKQAADKQRKLEQLLPVYARNHLPLMPVKTTT